MKYCSNCQIQYDDTVAFCQECGSPLLQSPKQKPKKKKNKRWWKVLLCIVLILSLVLTILYSALRTGTSRVTDGLLFGLNFKAGEVEDILDDEDTKPSKKQEKQYVGYLEDLESEARRGLSKESKEVIEELEALSILLAKYSNGTITLTEENAEAEFNKCMKELKGGNAFTNFFSNLFAVPVQAAVPEGFEDVVQEILEAQMLHNMSSYMFKEGLYEEAVVLAAVAGVKVPESAQTAVLLANLLRQGKNYNDAEEMLKYALMLDVSAENTLVSLGMLYLDKGEYDDARYCFNRAFSVSGGGGPANQGMMLISFAEGDMGGAYLYMLEGAKDGYTSTITQVYDRFIELAGSREAYLEFAGPILEQYGFQNLMDFTRARTAFSPDLDTPGQQLTLDRNFQLPPTSGQVIGTSINSVIAAYDHLMFLLQTIFGDFNLEDLITPDGKLDLAGIFNNERLGILLNGQSIDTESLRDLYGTLSGLLGIGGNVSGTVDSLLGVIGSLGNKEEQVVYGQENYEQEVFWLNILYDYTEYQFLKIQKSHFVDISDKYMTDVVEDSMDHLLDQFDKVIGTQPNIGTLFRMLMLLVDNGSFISDQSYTKEEIERFTKDFCPFNDIMEEGYKECIILAEQYWLYSNNILSYIGDERIFNEELLQRNMLVAQVSTFFPIAGGMMNATIGLTCNVWGGLTYDGYMNDFHFRTSLHKYLAVSGATYPSVPDLPETTFGSNDKADFFTGVMVMDPIQVEGIIEELFEEEIQDDFEDGYSDDGDSDDGDSDEDSDEAPDDEAPDDEDPDDGDSDKDPDGLGDGSGGGSEDKPGGSGDKPGDSGDDGKQDGYDDPEREVCIIFDPDLDGCEYLRVDDGQSIMPDDEQTEQPGQDGSILDGILQLPDMPTGTTFQVKLGKRLQLAVDPKTGKTEIGVGWVLGGFQLGYDPESGDLYVYGRAGLDASLGKKLEKMGHDAEYNVGGVKAGFFMKGTYNLKKKEVVSTDIGAEMSANLGEDNVIEAALTIDPVMGVARDRAKVILLGKGDEAQTETQIGEFWNGVVDQVTGWFE